VVGVGLVQPARLRGWSSSTRHVAPRGARPGVGAATLDRLSTPPMRGDLDHRDRGSSRENPASPARTGGGVPRGGSDVSACTTGAGVTRSASSAAALRPGRSREPSLGVLLGGGLGSPADAPLRNVAFSAAARSNSLRLGLAAELHQSLSPLTPRQQVVVAQRRARVRIVSTGRPRPAGRRPCLRRDGAGSARSPGGHLPLEIAYSSADLAHSVSSGRNAWAGHAAMAAWSAYTPLRAAELLRPAHATIPRLISIRVPARLRS